MSDDTTPVRADVHPGDKIAGYRLEEQIGQGGMAVVYRAYDERLDRRVALKVLAPALAADTAFRTRFIRESRAAAAVDHPNIIPVYDAGDAGGCLFISMRYVQGGDVRSLLSGGRRLAPARAWNIVTQVAAALDAAHARQLIHRDVKPANMLLDRPPKLDSGKSPDNASQTPEHVYLSDFGISKHTVASNLTSTGQFVGTLDYIAPEQIEGHGIDGRTDQYSLACAAYELLVGAPPFSKSNGFALINSHLSEKPPSARSRRADLPAAVDLVLAKAMDKSPGQRYESCTRFARDLGRALGLGSGPLEAGTPAPPAAATTTGGKPWPATELATGTGAGAAAGAAAGAGTAQAAGSGPAAGTGSASGPGAGVADLATMLAAQGAAMGTGQQAPPAQQAPPGQQAPLNQQTPPGGLQHPAHQHPGQPYAGGQQWASGQQYAGGGWAPAQAGRDAGYAQYPAQQTSQQPGGPGGPTGPGWPQYPPQPPRRSGRPLLWGLLSAAAVIAVAAVVVIVLMNKGGGNPPANGSSSSASTPASSSPPTARAQATAISNVLSSSSATRGMLGPAVNAIEYNCASLSSSQLSSDVSTIQTVARQRNSEYHRAFNLQVSALTNGSQLKNDLLTALQASLNADNDYLKWAREEQSSGCFPAGNSAAFNNAGGYDNQAVTAKTTFANEWNPVAQQYGLPQVSQADI